MPALNISNIKDAKLGSTDLSAVYKGSIRIYGVRQNPPFIFSPINMEPVKGKEDSQYYFWASSEKQDESPYYSWLERPDGVGTDPTLLIKNISGMIDPATGKQGKCIVDGYEYSAYNTGNNDFQEKDDCDWIIKLKLKFREYGWTPESVILKGGIDDPNNPCYRDNRFPDLSTFYIAAESEIENG